MKSFFAKIFGKHTSDHCGRPEAAATASNNVQTDAPPAVQTDAVPIRYVLADSPPAGDALCSDDSCPCGPMTTIERGKGYLYISQEIVELRTRYPLIENARQAEERRLSELRQKAAGSGFATVYTSYSLGGTLVCERGARLRGLDLDIAAADARRWWVTGEIPLRATPKTSERVQPTTGADSAEIRNQGELDGTTLIMAAHEGKCAAVRLLLEKGADANAKDVRGRPALILASERGHAEVVKLLLEKGAEVDARDSDGGVTALWTASEKGYAEVVRLLLEKGAAVEAKKPDSGTSALWIASQEGHAGVVRLLLEKGAEMEVKRTNTGTTALLQASQDGHTEVVRLLLEKGAEVNARATTNGVTSLFIACVKGHRDVVSLLLKAKADFNVGASDGTTPLAIAKKMGHAQVVELLEKAGAGA